MTADWEEHRSEPRLPSSGSEKMRQGPTNSTVTYLIGRTSVDAPTVPSNNLHEKALDTEATPGWLFFTNSAWFENLSKHS